MKKFTEIENWKFKQFFLLLHKIHKRIRREFREQLRTFPILKLYNTKRRRKLLKGVRITVCPCKMKKAEFHKGCYW